MEGNRKDQNGQRLKYRPLIGVLPSLARGELEMHDLYCDASLESVLRYLLRQEPISYELMHGRSDSNPDAWHFVHEQHH